jgi:hypothetical protein
MNPTASHSFGDDITTRVGRIATAGGYGISGIVIQILMMYVITRDLLITSAISNYFAPITGTVQTRSAIVLLIAWIAWSTRGLGDNFGAFRHWGWIVLGSFTLMFLIEGLVTIAAGGNSKRIVIEGVNASIFVSSVSVAYLFAIRGRTPTQALRFLLQPYIYLAVIVAVLGLTAWSLVHTGVVEAADWYLPDQFAFGRQTVDGLSKYYSSPFYLSGILNESVGTGRLLGFNFSRATGLFEEPATAAFFVAPAIFLLPLVFGNRSSRWKLRLGILTILGFLLVVNSTTNMLTMTVLGFLVLAKVALTHPQASTRLMTVLVVLVLGVLAWVTFSHLGRSDSELLLITSRQLDGLRQSLDHGAFLGPGIFDPVGPGDPRGSMQRGLLSWFAVLFHIATLSIIGIRMLLSRSPRWYLGGAILYLAVHSMKSFGHTAASGYYVYMLVVLALVLACHWQAGRSEMAAASQGGGRSQDEDPHRGTGMALRR